MSRLTRTQAEALATFIVRMRDDWSHGGVMAAIERANIVDGLDTARALVNLAADKTATTPALLVKPGPWWRDPTGENMAPPRNSMPCHEHPGQSWPCPECEATREPATPAVRAQAIADARAAIAAARSKPRPTVRPEVGPGSVA